jgi:hypothetical protein
MKLSEMILDGIAMILNAVIAGLKDDPDIDTSKAEQTAIDLQERLNEYREARKLLEGQQV